MKYIYLFLFVTFSTLSFGQVTYWQTISKEQIEETGTPRKSFPLEYRTFRLDLAAIKSILNTAINEDLPSAYSTTSIISLPLPDGKYGRFRVAESNLMPDALKQLFPQIRTFTARGIDDPYAVAKLDYTAFGFHAMIMSPNGWVFIDPFYLGNSLDYICYDKKNSVRTVPFTCDAIEQDLRAFDSHQFTYSVARTNGTQLKTYRLALACTGEYAAYYGGTTTGAASGMATSANRVSGVYELELAVRLTLVSNNNLLIYTNASTDPYTNNNGSTMLGENQTNVTTVIGSANYDIGHVFSTGGGGVAYLGCVCNASNKAGGVTGSSAPIGDNFDIDYVAHEMGHQYGGNHTFNSTTGSCNGNRASSAAYEPGSGTTIMAYAGICGTDNTQAHSDAIFHTKSFDEIAIYITTGGGSGCPVVTATGNTPPVINAGSNYIIPFQTPFVLTGSATDANSDPLTYLWEEYDLGTAGTINAASTTAPIFRVFTPTVGPSRTFPKLSDIVTNTTTFGEVLPTVARSLNFKFTARDNRSGGGGVTNNATNVVLTVVNTTTPFKVTAPNTAVTWFTASTQTVTWDVSGTNGGTINCPTVNILLSIDGGYTYPYTLASAVSNNGSASITVPGVTTTTARVKVESVGNVFFDISNINFTIASGGGVLTVLTTNAIASSNLCAGAAVSVGFSGDGPPNSGNIYTAQLSNAAGSFASPVSIGTLTSTASSGTISCTIPGGTAQGIGYRIRVISSNPVITGSNNGTNLSIYQTVGSAGSISGTATVCQGQVGVVYTVPAVTNATTYSWTVPTGASITAGSTTNSITVTYSASAVSGSITVVGSNPCSSSNTASYSVTVNVLPSAAGAISGPLSICQYQSAVFSVATISGATSYTWALPSGASITSGSGTNTVTILFSSSGSGTVSVTGTNSCGSGSSSSTTIVVNATPAATVVSPTGPVVICNGGNVQLSYTSVGGVAYQWQLNGSDISGANASPYTASATGNYSVVATTAFATTQTVTNSTQVSIPDNSCTPATSVIAVSAYSSAIATAQIQVKINITHTWVGDLVIVLLAPNGSIIGLSNQTGSSGNSGDNFTNTVFTDAAAAVLPTTGAPYTGSYKPVATTFTTCTTTITNVTTFGAIGSGSLNPNGNWTLKVFDRAGSDLGTIDNWSLILPGIPGGCSSTSNIVTVTAQSSPVITGIFPSSGVAGTSVSIDGSGFTSATTVTFNGVSASFVIYDDFGITATAPAGVTTGPVNVSNICGTVVGPTFSVSIPLNLKVFIEGYYRGAGQMIGVLFSSICDTLQVSLANAASPYAIVITSKVVMDLNGNCTVELPLSTSGNSFYIVLSHRNSLQTWSKLPVLINSAGTTYNFTTADTQAFGNNMVSLGGGVYGIRSGDVNQDGFINFTDITTLQSAALLFSNGYVAGDLTGDRVIESTDYSLLENNVAVGYSVLRP